jgi:5-carboxyvanillate decarboxylase
MTSSTPVAGATRDTIHIAAEEAFAPAEMLRIYRQILDGPNPDPGVVSLLGST